MMHSCLYGATKDWILQDIKNPFANLNQHHLRVGPFYTQCRVHKMSEIATSCFTLCCVHYRSKTFYFGHNSYKWHLNVQCKKYSYPFVTLQQQNYNNYTCILLSFYVLDQQKVSYNCDMELKWYIMVFFFFYK